MAPGRGRRPDVHSRERELNLDVIPIAVSTAGSIVYKELKSDSRDSRKPYSLHIKHSHTTHTLNTTAYQPPSSPRASYCNLYHQYCKYLRLHTNLIP